MAERYGAEMTIPDWQARLVCSRCRGRRGFGVIHPVRAEANERILAVSNFLDENAVLISAERSAIKFELLTTELPRIASLARAMIGCHCSADRVGDRAVAAIAV